MVRALQPNLIFVRLTDIIPTKVGGKKYERKQ